MSLPNSRASSIYTNSYENLRSLPTLSELLAQFPIPPTTKPKQSFSNFKSPLTQKSRSTLSGSSSNNGSRNGTLRRIDLRGSSDTLASEKDKNTPNNQSTANNNNDTSQKENMNPSSTTNSQENAGLQRFLTNIITKFDDKAFDMLLRVCKNTGTGKDLQEITTLLGNADKFTVTNALEKAQKLILDSLQTEAPAKSKSKLMKAMNSVISGKEEVVIPKVSKFFFDFSNDGKDKLPLNKEVAQDFTITNLSAGNSKIKFKMFPGVPTRRYDIVFNPKEGTIKPKQVQTVQIKLIARSTVQFSHVVTLEIEGGPRYFMVIKGESEKSVFGVDVAELECTNDAGLQIPSVLVTMKNYLYENDALLKEGIFRLPGDENEGNTVKDQLNRGTFCGCKDVNCVANLIKVWFRELPQQVLNSVPKETLIHANELDDCLKVLTSLPEPNRSITKWLLELLADVAANEQQNKMSARNLAIVVAPNLFSTSEIDPVESLTLSQKVVNFVFQLLEYQLSEKSHSDSQS